MSVKSFLAERAVDVMLAGRYQLDSWLDAEGKPKSFVGHTSRVSPFRMMVAGPVRGKVGDHVRSYFSEFGPLDGRVSDITSREFLLELKMSGAMRKRMADKLDWLQRRQADPAIHEMRRHVRTVPEVPHSLITFADGSTRRCFIIDVSASGAAISAEVQPEIGTPLALGSCVGRVVRHLPGGFAIQFVDEQSRIDLEHRLARPTPRHAAD